MCLYVRAWERACLCVRACVRVCVIVARPTCLLLSKRNCAELEQDRGGSLQGRKHFHLDYRNHLQPYFSNIHSTNMTATIISSFLDYGDVSYKVGCTLFRENRAPEYDVFAANNISLATLHFWVRISTFVHSQICINFSSSNTAKKSPCFWCVNLNVSHSSEW